MISNGHTKDSVDSLPMDIKMDLRRLWDSGVLGWRQQELIGYRNFQMLEALYKAFTQSKSKKFTSYSDYSPQDDRLLVPPKKPETKEERAMRLINLADAMSGKPGATMEALNKCKEKNAST